MEKRYFPPIFKGKQFNCIHCGVYAGQDWYDLYIHNTSRGQELSDFKATFCCHCGGRSFWHKEKMIIPLESPIELHHADMPEDCISEYQEARGVFSISPRAAAALLRLCIQKLLPHLGEKGKNINDDIKSLVAKGLPVLVQKALDYCRVVGNNAVHPGEIDINDTPEIAQNLFRMINFIIEDRITRPKEIEALYNQLPQTSREAIDKRDNGTAKSH